MYKIETSILYMQYKFILLVAVVALLSSSCKTKKELINNTQSPNDTLPNPYATKSSRNFSNVIGWKDNQIKYIFLILSVILLIMLKFVAVPVIIFLYILLSIVQNILVKRSE